MEGNNESLISVKCANFKDEDVKFQIHLRVDFGKQQCTERMEKIKEYGIDPSNNAIVIVHEFPTEDGAQKMAEKINELKTMLAPQIGKPAELFESAKAQGKNVVASLRIPPEGAGPLAILDAAAANFGDFASKHQFAEFKIADSRSLKDIVFDQSSGVIAAALQALCIKLTLNLNHELPIKVADFICTMGPPESEAKKIKFVGHSVATFHHLKLEIELREPNEAMKQVLKNEVLGGIMGLSQMVYGMGTQFGVVDLLKNGGTKTTAWLCLSPILSFEFGVFAPTAVETIEQAATSGAPA